MIVRASEQRCETRTAMRGGDVVFRPVNVPGPTALAIRPAPEDLPLARQLIAAYSDRKDVTTIMVSEMHTASKPIVSPEPVANRETFQPFML